MTMKRGAAKGVSLSRRKAKGDAFEKLPTDASVAELKAAAVHVSLADLEDRVADVRDSWETDSLFEDAFEELAKGNIDLSDCKCLFYSSLFYFQSFHSRLLYLLLSWWLHLHVPNGDYCVAQFII